MARTRSRKHNNNAKPAIQAPPPEGLRSSIKKASTLLKLLRIHDTSDEMIRSYHRTIQCLEQHGVPLSRDWRTDLSKGLMMLRSNATGLVAVLWYHLACSYKSEPGLKKRLRRSATALENALASTASAKILSIYRRLRIHTFHGEELLRKKIDHEFLSLDYLREEFGSLNHSSGDQEWEEDSLLDYYPDEDILTPSLTLPPAKQA